MMYKLMIFLFKCVNYASCYGMLLLLNLRCVYFFRHALAVFLT